MSTVSRHRSATRTGLLILWALALVLPFVLASYFVFQATIVLCYALALLGLVVITGYAGQLALGNGAFFAIGAFTTASLMSEFDVSFLLTVCLAAIVSFILGLLLGGPALRLKGHFLAVSTLAIGVSAPPIMKHFESFSGGVRGINLIAADPPAWLHLDPVQGRYFLALALFAVATAVTGIILNSHIGRNLKAVRDNEMIAASLGIRAEQVKVTAFAYSAVLASVGGSMYALAVGYVTTEAFTIGFAAMLVIGLVIGGKDSIMGAIIGAAFIVGAPILAASIDPALSGVTFAVIVIVMMLVLPQGTAGAVRWLLARRAQRAVTVNTSQTQEILK